MNRTILYYPTIDIPKNNWLRHSLLYWDEVSSIVPKSWDDQFLINLSPEIHYLLDEGQFRPIKPEDLISKGDNWQEFENFQQEFTEVVASKEFLNFIKRRSSSSNYRIHENKIGLTSRVHSNQTSDSIYHYLEERGLANREGYNEWINFEPNTALLYMSLLAKYLADIDSNQTTIGTDYITYEKFNFKRVSDTKGFPVVSFNLNNVLPTPRENVPFEKIVSFKKKREQNLRHFKKTMSDFQNKISNSASNAEMKETAIDFQESLLNGVDDLAATLKDHKIGFTTKSIKSLINLKTPTSIAAIGTVLNSNLNIIEIPLNMAAIGVATIGAIELTTNYIENRNKQSAKLRESAFSYIYYAKKQGIII
ncbi:DUF6236 family protein [Myroides odoratimimus]|uniref:DUF6236 family protein n=1 Tax=Myroides odoratimimus TaxID=76832 RepID=UPI002578FA36|nr:DUF6236 family protein [Myroides odoratimimus]MDM1086443.1 hypothetical protein [Myroides odoratimimus]